MATLLLDAAQADPRQDDRDGSRWLIFRYAPAALFSLKSSRATSTAGTTLVTPTPYAVKMAFLDAALRHGLTENPEQVVRWLAAVSVRIGMPRSACVTGTIQSVRQETRREDRKRDPGLPPYRASIAMREFVHYHGAIRLAFSVQNAPVPYLDLLIQAAPAINYLGKRGSFIQYLSSSRQADLDATFTQPVDQLDLRVGQRVTLDDFGPAASFDSLNSFSPTEIRRGMDRIFVETIVPFDVFNAGPGFVHYRAPEV